MRMMGRAEVDLEQTWGSFLYFDWYSGYMDIYKLIQIIWIINLRLVYFPKSKFSSVLGIYKRYCWRLGSFLQRGY